MARLASDAWLCGVSRIGHCVAAAGGWVGGWVGDGATGDEARGCGGSRWGVE